MAAKKAPDLILLDINMPIMDGLEATRLIRGLDAQSGRHTAVIAVSAGVDRDTCLAAGADAFVEKPVRLPVLRERLQRVGEYSRR